MLTRRLFLASAGATALMLHPAAAIPTTTPVMHRNPALDIVIDVIQDYFNHLNAWGGPAQLRGKRRKQYDEWHKVDNLEEKIIETIRSIYNDPFVAKIKAARGSIMSEPNRLDAHVQLLFADRIPMNPQYAGNPRVFGAFASFAPAHLL